MAFYTHQNITFAIFYIKFTILIFHYVYRLKMMFLCIKTQQLKDKNSLSFIRVHAILAQLLAVRYA